MGIEEIALPKEKIKAIRGFLETLRKTYGDDLVSVILYGSAASGDFIEKHSNINLLVVLSDTGLAELSKIAAPSRRRIFRAITPVFFTEAYIQESADVFPIEFLDMKDNYSVLYGKDVLKTLSIDKRNLRFQCEQELKSKLITIKRQYLTTSNRKEIERLLFKSFTSAIHILRNLLRLKGIEPPYIKEQVVGIVEREFAIDATVFNEILWARGKNMALTCKDVDALLTGFVKELEAIARTVDTM
jgi:predicted nucleotidyltransferase